MTSSPVFDSRMSRGADIARVESNVRRIDQHEYRVRSQSRMVEYQVLNTESGWSCSCPDASFRQVKCKHVFAVELSLELRRRIEDAKRIVPLDYQSCLGCGSERIVRDGVLHNRSGDIQRYSCKECGKRFTLNLGFERMHATPKAITSAMQLYFTGESLRSVQKFLRLQGVNVSHVTVYRWVRKYVELMGRYLDQITPRVSDTWRADEMYVRFKGNMKYVFSMMDDESRFWLAQEVSHWKEEADTTKLFRKAKTAAGKVPKTLITDALPSYHVASKSEFGHHTAHVREISLKGKIHNNRMERFNGELRDRERVMRGLKKMDTPILRGIQIYHNFVRPHEGLNGDTPADRAGIRVEGHDKWLTLIQNASHLQRRNKEENSGRRQPA